ncbi:hypothetical protein JOM56_009736 [Amanita muscaria]
MKLEKWGPRVFLSDNFSHVVAYTECVVKAQRQTTKSRLVTWSDAEEEGEEGEEGEDLVDGLEENSEDSEGAQDFTSIHNAVGAPITRLEAVIAPVISRIECGALRRTQNEDPVMPENALGPDPFLDNIIRMPAARDPPMWRESDQTHALWVIHDRLEKTPHLAISASSSPHNRGWIAIESTSIAAVEKLCQNVSAIPQPPQIDKTGPIVEKDQGSPTSSTLTLPAALNFNIKATYSELQIFSEGFESVSNHSFKMTVSTKEFMQLSWEKHVRAPLEVGHRIRASIQQQQIEATVVEVILSRFMYRRHITADKDGFCYSRCIHRVIQGSTKEFKLESDEASRGFWFLRLYFHQSEEPSTQWYCSAEVKLRNSAKYMGFIYYRDNGD